MPLLAREVAEVVPRFGGVCVEPRGFDILPLGVFDPAALLEHETERVAHLGGPALALQDRAEDPFRALEVPVVHLELGKLVTRSPPAVGREEALLE